MRNLHQLFVLCTTSQIIGGDFSKFCGLLRIYELYCGCTAEMSESANVVLGTLARFVFFAFKPESIVERSTGAKIWLGQLCISGKNGARTALVVKIKCPMYSHLSNKREVTLADFEKKIHPPRLLIYRFFSLSTPRLLQLCTCFFQKQSHPPCLFHPHRLLER